jgi:hypothetical protein
MKNNTFAMTLFAALALCSLAAHGAEGATPQAAAAPVPQAAAPQSAAQAPDLKSFNFAVGLGALFLRNGNDILNSAVDNGVLRVTNEERYKLGFWLSSATFFKPEWLDNALGLRHGLFMAAQVGSGNNADVLNSFAVGYTLASSEKPRGGAGTAQLAFQIGYGLTRIQTFANGYAAGMTMPTGTNQPVMTRTIGRGPVLIVSTAIF